MDPSKVAAQTKILVRPGGVWRPPTLACLGNACRAFPLTTPPRPFFLQEAIKNASSLEEVQRLEAQLKSGVFSE